MLTINGYKLDDFTEAYIGCMLWSSMDESDENTGGQTLDANYGIADIHPATMEQIIADCNLFQSANGEHFNDNHKQAGHDYWLTRNGHGSGFWDYYGDDCPYSKEGQEILTTASKAAGEIDPYVDDDGMIRL